MEEKTPNKLTPFSSSENIISTTHKNGSTTIKIRLSSVLKFRWLILGIIILILVATGTVFFLNRNKQTVCNQGSKKCPNGSAVGRFGPKCEFAKCAGVIPTPKLIITPTPKVWQFASPSAFLYVNDNNEVIISGLENLPSDFASFVKNYFYEQKAGCDKDNGKLHFAVLKVVKDKFADVSMNCHGGGIEFFVKQENRWIWAFTLQNTPGCDLVNKYKFTKEIIQSCYPGNGMGINLKEILNTNP